MHNEVVSRFKFHVSRFRLRLSTPELETWNLEPETIVRGDRAVAEMTEKQKPETQRPGSSRARLMGVLNVTPDSFSDGGRYFQPEAAAQRALELEAQGADILDIGAESTRPGSSAVSAPEQSARLLPVLKLFRRHSALPVSIDTRVAAVAEACLDEGANIINDISALRHDPLMPGLAARRKCGVILMHMLGTPETMQQDPHYDDVVTEIVHFMRERLAACAESGIMEAQLMIDPGIGFGKTLEHNLAILRRLGELMALQRPVVVGASRKSFLGLLTGERIAERRTAASVAAGVLAVQNGAAILRVHDVAEHRAALKVLKALSS